MLGLGRETTARVLASGLAGAPVRTAAATLYDADRVAALRDRPEATVALVRRTSPEGLPVARPDPRRAGPEGPWRASLVTAACFAILAREHGGVPLVATVRPYVLSCHDVVGVEWTRTAERGRHASKATMRLTAARTWQEELAGTLLRTPPGHPLLAWQCPLLPNHPRRTRTR